MGVRGSRGKGEEEWIQFSPNNPSLIACSHTSKLNYVLVTNITKKLTLIQYVTRPNDNLQFREDCTVPTQNKLETVRTLTIICEKCAPIKLKIAQSQFLSKEHWKKAKLGKFPDKFQTPSPPLHKEGYSCPISGEISRRKHKRPQKGRRPKGKGVDIGMNPIQPQ